MGAGIAEVCARTGHEVGLFDLDPAALERGQERLARSLARGEARGRGPAAPILARVHSLAELGRVADAELVVEAVSEDLALKKELFARLSGLTTSAILASNTSALSVTELASASQGPERVIGLHFFNPAPVMELVEIVLAEQTSPATREAASQFVTGLTKTPIVVRDVAGFATSRLGILLGMEAIRMVETQVASVEDIDRAMELGYRHPMGPLKLTDLVGLDVRLAIAEHLTRELGPQFAPPPLLRRLVRAGKLGKKSGEGFYLWDGERAVMKG